MSPRPKIFDPEKALDKAIDLFWKKGYEATSMRDLVKHMGINRFSIYDNFKSKKDLFMAACERYWKMIDRQMISILEKGDSGLTSIESFFEYLLGAYSGPMSNRGCLMTNTITEKAWDDKDIREYTSYFLKRIEDAFYFALRRANQSGELESTTDLRVIAQYLVNVVNGINVTYKAFRDINRVSTMIDTTLLLLPRM
jgi:TetR/AcrR family transcriptional regulator, transcriptional repressor for nem operon